MRFEAIALEDLNELARLQPEGWPDIVPEFEYYIKKNFCYPIKVTADNAIIGIGASIIFNGTCWLAHIIVDENYRNQGIGRRITDTLMNDPECNSVETFLLIATELGFPVYEKAGFRIVTEYKYLKRDKPWRDTLLSPAIMPYENRFYSQIMVLDHKITAEDRSPLLSDYLKNTLVFVENSSTKGFYMPGLGEGLIIADTINAGLELMKVKYSRSDKAVLPSDNQSGIYFLLQNGFIMTDTKGTRMIRGKDIEWMPQKIFSRIGGNYG